MTTCHLADRHWELGRVEKKTSVVPSLQSSGKRGQCQVTWNMAFSITADLDFNLVGKLTLNRRYICPWDPHPGPISPEVSGESGKLGSISTVFAKGPLLKIPFSAEPGSEGSP